MRYGFVFACAVILGTAALQASAPPPKPDLADLVSGNYAGDVISDARGSSRDNVDVTVSRIAPNTVSVKSSYSRIPARTFRLERIMDTIQNKGGEEVFLVELKKSPISLMLTIDDVSWAGVRSGDAIP